MSLNLISQALSQESIKGVISLDSEGQLVVQDQMKAMNIMVHYDANSPVYKIVQLAMQMQTIRDQIIAKENLENFQKLITAGKIKILELEAALQENQDRIKSLETEIQDENTRKRMHQYELNVNEQARISGIGNIALGIILLPLVVTTIQGFVLIAKGAIQLDEKPYSLLMLQDKMERYKAFHPNSSLTEAYEYSLENPGKFSQKDADKFIGINAYREKNPEASLEDYEEFIAEKIQFQKLLENHLQPRRRRRTRF